MFCVLFGSCKKEKQGAHGISAGNFWRIAHKPQGKLKVRAQGFPEFPQLLCMQTSYDTQVLQNSYK